MTTMLAAMIAAAPAVADEGRAMTGRDFAEHCRDIGELRVEQLSGIQGLCGGLLKGVTGMHYALVELGRIAPIWCPPAGVGFKEYVAAIVTRVNADRELAERQVTYVIPTALVKEYPCQ